MPSLTRNSERAWRGSECEKEVMGIKAVKAFIVAFVQHWGTFCPRSLRGGRGRGGRSRLNRNLIDKVNRRKTSNCPFQMEEHSPLSTSFHLSLIHTHAHTNTYKHSHTPILPGHFSHGESPHRSAPADRSSTTEEGGGGPSRPLPQQREGGREGGSRRGFQRTVCGRAWRQTRAS